MVALAPQDPPRLLQADTVPKCFGKMDGLIIQDWVPGWGNRGLPRAPVSVGVDMVKNNGNLCQFSGTKYMVFLTIVTRGDTHDATLSPRAQTHENFSW